MSLGQGLLAIFVIGMIGTCVRRSQLPASSAPISTAASSEVATATEPLRPGPGESPPSRLSAEELKMIDDAAAKGYLVLEPKKIRALVDAGFWSIMDVHAKEKFAAASAAVCAESRGDQLYEIDIVDRQSARKLGNWSHNWGLKVE